MAKVSVIVPAYNAAKWIGETIQSVLQQTFQDWELWIVDDGSTDSTLEEIGKYPDKRIRAISQLNSGQEFARQAGLDSATGDFVVFLDADDLLLSTALQDLVEAAMQNPRTIVHGNWAYVDARAENPIVQISYFTRGPGLKTLVYFNPCQNHSVLIPREFLIKSGGLHVDEDVLSDWHRWLQLALAGYRFCHLPKLVALYRRHLDGYSYDAERRINQRMATLEAFWKDPRVPDEIFALKSVSYATAYVDFACDAWRVGDREAAWQQLCKGQARDPLLLTRVDTAYRLLHAREGLSFQPKTGFNDVEWLLQRAQADSQLTDDDVESAWYAALGLSCYHYGYWRDTRIYLGEALRLSRFWGLRHRDWVQPFLAAHFPKLVLLRRELRRNKSTGNSR